MNLDVDVVIVVGFLLLNLGVGLYYSRGVTNIKDYALGGRNFSTATLIATIVATWIGGNSLGIATFDSTEMGVFFMVPGVSDVVCFLILGYIIAPRMSKFLGCVSVAEAMGNLWGSKVRFISSISGIVPAVGSIAVQFVILSSLLSYLLEISNNVALIISALIVITYSTVGGIRAVAFTDVLQFITFGIVIPMVAFVIWQSFYSNQPIYDTLSNNPIFDYNQLLDFQSPYFFNNIVLFLFFIIPGFDPTVFQRMSMAKDVNQAIKVFTCSGLVMFFCQYLLLYLIGLLLLSGGVTDLNISNIVEHIFTDYLGQGTKGIFIIGIMAMLMSTADSYINSSSVLFVNDFCRTIGLNFSTKKEIVVVRFTAIFIGFSALLLSIYFTSLLDLILSTYSFYLPVVSVPFLMAIFGFNTSGRAVLFGMGAGFTTVIIFMLFSEIDSLIPGMLANLLGLLIFHYVMQEQGMCLIQMDNAEFNEIKKLRIERRNNYIKFLLQLPNSITNFNILVFCNRYRQKYSITYMYFALFVLLGLVPSFMIEESVYHRFSLVIHIFQVILLTVATTFFCNQLLPKQFTNHYMGFMWCVSIFICLILISSILTLLSNLSHLSLIVLTLHFVLVPILLSWEMALIIIPTGLLISFYLYQSFVGGMILGEIYDLKLKLVYVMFIMISFVITILRNKQEQFEITEAKAEHLESEVKILAKEVGFTKRELENVVQGLDFLDNQFKDKEGKLKAKEIYLKDQLKLRNIEISKLKDLKDEFIRNIPHETNTPMTGILSLSEVLYSCYDSLDEKLVKQSIKDIVSSSDRLKSYVNNIADLSKLSALTYELNKTEVHLSEMVRERPVLYKKIFADDDKQEFKFKVEDNIIVHCDEYYITQAIDNLISNAVKYGEGKLIIISLTKLADNKVQFSITDEGIGIPQDELISIFHKFTVSSKTQTPAGGRGVGLALCEKVITVHGGTIEAKSDGKKGSSFRFVLPL